MFVVVVKDRPTTIRFPEHISGWVNYPPAYVIWVDGCVARPVDRGDAPCEFLNAVLLAYAHARALMWFSHASTCEGVVPNSYRQCCCCCAPAAACSCLLLLRL